MTPGMTPNAARNDTGNDTENDTRMAPFASGIDARRHFSEQLRGIALASTADTKPKVWVGRDAHLVLKLLNDHLRELALR